MKEKPVIEGKRTVAESRLFAIEEVDLRFSNGRAAQFERINGHHTGAVVSVMMVPCLDEETLLLVREYAVGVEDYVLTFPKGAIDPGEPVLAAAQRELQEEIGYAAKRFTPMQRLSPSPAYISGHMQILLAQDLYPSALVGDEPESLTVVPWRMADLDKLIDHPEFMESRCLAALLLYYRRYYGR